MTKPLYQPHIKEVKLLVMCHASPHKHEKDLLYSNDTSINSISKYIIESERFLPANNHHRHKTIFRGEKIIVSGDNNLL